MRPFWRTTLLAVSIAMVPVNVLAYTNFQLNAVNEDRPLYDPYECDPNATNDTVVSNKTVVLDPGHSGGPDFNATAEIDSTSNNGIYKSVNITGSGVESIDNSGAPNERHDMWDAANIIKKRLVADGYKVQLTKDSENANVGLMSRALIANEAHAAIAVSLHYTGGVKFGTPSDHWGVTPQQVGEYRTNESDGKTATFTDTTVAGNSQQFAQDIAAARVAAGDNVKVAPLDQSFPQSRGLPAYGNISIVQLFSKVPWVYNEDGADGFNMKSYTDGITSGIEKAIGNGTTGGSSSCCATSDTLTGALSGKDNEQKAFNYFTGKGLNDVQAAAIIGNFMVESTMDPHANNGSHIGIAQWDIPNRWADLLSFAKANNIDPYGLSTQLDFSWKEFTGGYRDVLAKLKTYTSASDLPAAVSLINNKYEISGNAAEAQREKDARDALKLYGGSATTGSSSGPTPTGGCSNVTGVSGGSIVKTALGLAWPNPYYKNPDHSPYTPTPAYKTAWDGASDYTDCGAFVATVMISSGVDKKYPKVGTSVQEPYLEGSSDYTVIKSPHSSSQLQPGDILIYSVGSEGHTFIYTGPQKNGFNSASASLTDHTPQQETPGELVWMFGQPNLIAARHK